MAESWLSKKRFLVINKSLLIGRNCTVKVAGYDTKQQKNSRTDESKPRPGDIE